MSYKNMNWLVVYRKEADGTWKPVNERWDFFEHWIDFCLGRLEVRSFPSRYIRGSA